MYLVWKRHGGNPTHIHESIESAKAEAERLARLFKNDEFFVLEAVASVKIKDVEWKNLKENQQMKFLKKILARLLILKLLMISLQKRIRNYDRL